MLPELQRKRMLHAHHKSDPVMNFKAEQMETHTGAW
jgi:hypothetical protein